jgi:hypothetical protein
MNATSFKNRSSRRAEVLSFQLTDMPTRNIIAEVTIIIKQLSCCWICALESCTVFVL